MNDITRVRAIGRAYLRVDRADDPEMIEIDLPKSLSPDRSRAAYPPVDQSLLICRHIFFYEIDRVYRSLAPACGPSIG